MEREKDKYGQIVERLMRHWVGLAVEGKIQWSEVRRRWFGLITLQNWHTWWVPLGLRGFEENMAGDRISLAGRFGWVYGPGGAGRMGGTLRGAWVLWAGRER